VLDANPDCVTLSEQKNLPEDCKFTPSSGVNGNGVNLDTDFPTEGTGSRFIRFNLLSLYKRNVPI
jgi:hypothetical protein